MFLTNPSTNPDHRPRLCLFKEQLCRVSSIPVFGGPSELVSGLNRNQDSQQAGQGISHDLLLE